MKSYTRVGALCHFEILEFFSLKLSYNQFLISTMDKYYEEHVEFKMNIVVILLSILTPKWLSP